MATIAYAPSTVSTRKLSSSARSSDLVRLSHRPAAPVLPAERPAPGIRWRVAADYDEWLVSARMGNRRSRPRLCENMVFEVNADAACALISLSGHQRVGTLMKRFIQGECRTQSVLLPEALDDYVNETNPVRVVDVFVDELDLGRLGFEGIKPAATGRPAYHPAVLLKLYIYGYLNRVQSSRRLEKEAQRNVEVMWLTGR